MKDLNDNIEIFSELTGLGPIDSGLNLDLAVGMMATENIGVGLSSSFLMGLTSGESYGIFTNEFGVEIGRGRTSTQEIKVIGITFALRPLLRQKLGDHIALCLGGDVGVIRLSYSYSEERYVRTGRIERPGSEKTEALGVGPLFGGFASAQVLIGHFFLLGDIGFRSAKGEVEFEKYDATQEIDFSGPYLLMTVGGRF